MTQKYAIVPVYELSDTDTAQYAAKRAGWTHHAQGMMLKTGENAGKLTRDQVDAMVDEYIFMEANWFTTDECMIAALKKIGLSVEE